MDVWRADDGISFLFRPPRSNTNRFACVWLVVTTVVSFERDLITNLVRAVETMALLLPGRKNIGTLIIRSRVRPGLRERSLFTAWNATIGGMCHPSSDQSSRRGFRALSDPHRQHVAFEVRRSGAVVRMIPRHCKYSTQTIYSKPYPPHTVYSLPALSPTMNAGTISQWQKQVGDSFSAGDVLCTIETDKAAVDFEAQDEGVLAKILREGTTAQDLPVGTPICIVVENETDVPSFVDFVVEGMTDVSSPAPSSQPVVATGTITTAFGDFTSGTSILFPAARHLAESKGLDATGLQGSGKGGRVTKGDVLKAMEAGKLPPLQRKTTGGSTPTPESSTTASVTTPSMTIESKASIMPSTTAATPPPMAGPKVSVTVPTIETTGTFEDVTNTKMRKIIASRLTESKSQVPHFYTSMQVELDNLMKLRKQLATQFDVKVSVNDFIIRCCAVSLRDVPEVNGTVSATGQWQFHDTIDVSVAVATPTGLITPIVFNTDKLGLAEITAKVKDLADRARQGKLAPHEYQGGTFSISNLGMFGIDEFSAVINPPQAAILAVGGGSRTIVPTPYGSGEKPQVKQLLTARLSADRRVVDEATAGLFLAAFRQYMNQPDLLLL